MTGSDRETCGDLASRLMCTAIQAADAIEQLLRGDGVTVTASAIPTDADGCGEFTVRVNDGNHRLVIEGLCRFMPGTQRLVVGVQVATLKSMCALGTIGWQGLSADWIAPVASLLLNSRDEIIEEYRRKMKRYESRSPAAK